MPFQHSSNSQPRPRNRPATALAVQAMNRLAPAINEQLDNSLQVNSYEVLVYNRLKTGLKCSCCGGDGLSSSGVLDADGSASPSTINEMLTGGAFGILDYGDSPDDSTGRQVVEGTVSTRANATASRLEKAGSTEFDGNGYVNALGAADGPNFDDIPLNPFAEGHMVSCPVCFGGGFVGGYQVSRSWRQVVAAVSQGVVIDGGEIDSLPKPWEIVLYERQSKMEFSLQLPAGAVQVDSVRVFDGVKDAGPGCVFQVQVAGGWVNVTAAVLLQQCDGQVHSFRVLCLQSEGIRFTHVEFQLGVSDKPLLINYPKLTETADTSILESIQDIQMICSPQIEQLRPFDIVTDLNNRRAWMIREVIQNDNNARIRTNYGKTAQARVIQANEIWSILPIRMQSEADFRHRTYGWGANLSPPR